VVRNKSVRAFSTAVAAAALGVERRWLDNVIDQNRIEGIDRGGHGVSREISPKAVLTIAVAIELMDAIGSPVSEALDLAVAVARTGRYAPSGVTTIEVDVEAIERELAMRLSEAVEAHPPAKRGRPPRTR
jgi:hypothetical protein